MELVRPAFEHLASYVDALERGWSADNVRGAVAAREELALIAADAASFLDRLDDREAKGAPIALPDGSLVPRLPGFRKWIWDGALVGSIGLRWQKGTAALPPFCLGHIGYAVVPWKRQQGHATQALGLILHDARSIGLPHVDITTDPDNVASQKVIEANRGYLVERFVSAHYGDEEHLRFRIDLA